MAHPASGEHTHAASLRVSAPPQVVYEAFVRPERLIAWLPPQGAQGRISAFEPWPGGRFDLTLTFADAKGKSSAKTDVVEARFVELARPLRIVFAVTFQSPDPSFAGVMTMTWTFQPDRGGTLVTIVAQDVPRGISREDHETGLLSTLANLDSYLRSASPDVTAR